LTFFSIAENLIDNLPRGQGAVRPAVPDEIGHDHERVMHTLIREVVAPVLSRVS